jgi:Uma2 family endonuclease
MASHPTHFYTPEEYLALERAATYKSEYCAGEIFAMSGTSRQHNRIGLNIANDLSRALEPRDCDVYAYDLRVRTPDSLLYTYPDIIVTCGEAQFEDSRVDTLLNPILIIEVLSPSTETYDRTKKFTDYRKIESLVEYILVAQNEYRVTRFFKQSNGKWIFEELTNVNDTLKLSSIDCELEMKRIYRRVKFPEPEQTP